ncbi:MAG: CDP-alcohol phosphatidyltransferase family protein [Actinomycetaceae bacterium]|nr:CDP-alcohol phosphatidyltransferase family protein [Actinomycetaceae bacterium]
MLGNHGRDLARKVFTAPARGLAKLGVRPNHVTVTGTVATVAVSAALLATGKWVWGPIVVALVLFADSLDGTLARLTGEASEFGAFLDSTLDRIGDGAVFSSIVYWIAVSMAPSSMRTWLLIAGLITIVGAATVPYARARAESVGAQAKVGIAERTDRLVVVLLATFLVGLELPMWILGVGLTWVAFASMFTVGQRIFAAKRELEA